jgi:hypothetical protein
MKHVWIALLLFSAGCSGPVGPIPGGKLDGPVITEFADWSFASTAEQIQLETIGADGAAHSVNVWSGVVDGRLFIPTSLVQGAENPAEREWVKNALQHPGVRVRIDGRLFTGTAQRVSDEEYSEGVKQHILDKYASEAGARSAQAWVFEIDPSSLN